jgi:Lrp/AsnC family leucine-responsive transcriptional regulator
MRSRLGDRRKIKAGAPGDSRLFDRFAEIGWRISPARLEFGAKATTSLDTDREEPLVKPDALDDFDHRILSALAADGRLSIVDLAERVGLSQTPVRRRLQALEEAGVIDGYGARINRRRLGYGVTAFVEIKLESHKQEHTHLLRETIATLPEVTSMHVISGAGDLLLEIWVHDLEEYDRLLIDTILDLPIVKEVRTSFVMRTFKKDDVLAEPREPDRRGAAPGCGR